MAHNTPGEFAKMYSNRKAIEHLVQSPDAQALGEMLSQSHNGAELEKMAQNALSGDTAAIQSLMQSIAVASMAEDPMALP